VQPLEEYAAISGLKDLDAVVGIDEVERYTYLFDMNAQQLDHMFVSPSLAKKSNVKLVDRRFEVDKTEKNARLGLLKVHTVWQCDYESFRQFIYALESASPFVIIDDVSLAQSDANKPLTLVMELSTYFRLGANGN